MKKCEYCNGTGERGFLVPDGNPYSYNYQLKQDYTTVWEKCTNCKGTGNEGNSKD